MKKLVFSVILLAVIAAGKAQVAEIPKSKVDHFHKGLYLSMSLGPVFPSITDKAAGSYDLKFKGTGAQFDFKIGGAVKENFILHATITTNAMSGPKVTSGSSSQNTSNNLSLSETMLGGGATYYFMPVNIFLSGSLGIGNFLLIDGDNDTSVKTDRGFSMQLKAGKEWWISRKWGLGVALTYGKTKLTNSPGGGVEEQMDSNNFGILFNATLN